MSLVCGLTHSPDFARQLVATLHGHGIRGERIALMRPEATAPEVNPDVAEVQARFAHRPKRMQTTANCFGGVAGWTTGLAIAGAAAGAVAMILPEIGTLLMQTPHLWTLGLMCLGTLTGAIVGLGIAERDASFNDDRVRRDGLVIAIDVPKAQFALVDQLVDAREFVASATVNDESPAAPATERRQKKTRIESLASTRGLAMAV